jgi:hypothetical protein
MLSIEARVGWSEFDGYPIWFGERGTLYGEGAIPLPTNQKGEAQ